jgi:hypothetical protein
MKHEPRKTDAGLPDRGEGSILKLEFDKDKGFDEELRRRVNSYFQEGIGPL